MSLKIMSINLKLNRSDVKRMACKEFLINKRVTELHISTYDKLIIVVVYKGKRDEKSIQNGLKIKRVVDREM